MSLKSIFQYIELSISLTQPSLTKPSIYILYFLVLQAIEQVLVSQISIYWPTLQQVLDDTSISNAQVKEDGHKVHGAILVGSMDLFNSCHAMVVL